VTRQEGRTVLVLWGADRLTGHDAATGALLWQCGGFNPDNKKNWRNIASPTLSEGVAVVPYGREQYLAGVKTGGSGDITASARCGRSAGSARTARRPWPRTARSTSSTSRARRGASTCGPAGALDRRAYERQGRFYSSPALAGDTLYFCREDGAVTVGQATPSGLKVLNETRFDDIFVASPVLVRDRLLLRGEKFLYCVGR
jgi:hypothetical protein